MITGVPVRLANVIASRQLGAFSKRQLHSRMIRSRAAMLSGTELINSTVPGPVALSLPIWELKIVAERATTVRQCNRTAISVTARIREVGSISSVFKAAIQAPAVSK
jgi:hypothetical protein